MDPAVKPWWTLRDADFLQLQPGKTTAAEVRTRLGRPLAQTTLPRQNEEVWDYRFVEGATMMLAWLYFDSRGLVKYYTAQPDPAFYSIND